MRRIDPSFDDLVAHDFLAETVIGKTRLVDEVHGQGDCGEATDLGRWRWGGILWLVLVLGEDEREDGGNGEEAHRC